MSGFPDTVLVEQRAPILVLALGNMLLSDDGVGPVLLNQLAETHDRWKDQVEFVDGGTQGLSLLGHLSGRRALIIVDALKRGAPPGTVHRLTLPELHEISQGRAGSGHESNAGELLAAAQLLDELPDRVFIVGVEPGEIATGVGLSESVEQALSFASDQVRCLLAELC